MPFMGTTGSGQLVRDTADGVKERWKKSEKEKFNDDQ